MADAEKSLRALFDEASEIEDAERRRAYLDQACGGDGALRADIEELLRHEAAAGGFLADPKREPSPDGNPITEREGDRIGRYKLLQKIGEGGCGFVYMAEQTEPVKRRVALKIIKLGMDTKHVVARFEAERQALAMMDHPHIAKVLDAGATDAGRPYFVMELVRGIKVTDYCDQNKLSTQERLRLFVQVCQAVQHAHQKGIIHRDIKPSNILVTSNDGVPMPKVIDFGIAKAAADIQLTDKTLFTRFEMFIGTPAYMSPEQAEFNAADIDTRTDIYALGVLLYELLTGQTPFDAAELMSRGLDVMRQTIREKEPPKPSTRLTKELANLETARRKSTQGLAVPSQEEMTADARRRQRLREQIELLRGDLDWIVMKAIEKNRNRRYETANGLAADIQRYLANEPIVARPPSAGYRLQKLISRNKAACLAGALTLAALVAGVAAVIVVQHRANQDYRKRLYVSEINRAGLAWQSGQAGQSRALLDRCPEDLRGWEWAFLHQQLDRWSSTEICRADGRGNVAFSPESQLLAVVLPNAVEVRSFPDGTALRHLTIANGRDVVMAASPRGDLAAAMNWTTGDGTVWSLRAGEQVSQFKFGAPAGVLAWSHDGRCLAAGGRGMVRLWDAATGREKYSFRTETEVAGLAFSPDDATLAVGSAGGDVQLFGAADGVIQRAMRLRGSRYSQLLFSPNGKYLAAASSRSGGFGQDQIVWNLEGEGSFDLQSGGDVTAFSFSADSRRLIVGDASGAIRLWDLEHRAQIDRFHAHVPMVTQVHLLPDQRILSAGRDGKVLLWQGRDSGVRRLEGYPHSLRMVAFSPDSHQVAAAGISKEIRIWGARDGRLAGIYTNHSKSAHAAVFSPDGSVAASAAGDRTVKLWNPKTLETIWSASLAPDALAYWIVFSPDGRRIYVLSRVDTLSVLDAATGERLNAVKGLENELNELDGLAISPDGQRLVLCQKSRISVRRTDNLSELWAQPARPNRCATFSPDGQWIAVGEEDGSISLWETAGGGNVRRVLHGHAGIVTGVGFQPNGNRLVSSSVDGAVKVWDWRAGVEVLTLPILGGGYLWHAAFSPDGKTIAAAGGDGAVTLWRVK